MKRSIKRLLNSGLLLLLPACLYADAATGGDYDLTKVLMGASGAAHVVSQDYSAGYAVGEDAAGTQSQSSDYSLNTGYFSGFFGNPNFTLLGATIGPNKIMQDGTQVGVPLNASIQLVFSSQLDASTIAGGIQVHLVTDHLGASQDVIAPSTYNYDVTGATVVISAQGPWLGDTLYDVVANSNLQSIDDFALTLDAHTPFITLLDPHQENVVLHPIPATGAAQALGVNAAPSLSLDIPQGALPDYAYVLISQDPMHSPLRADPNILQTATQNAEISGGAYQTPIALQEIAAYNPQGQPLPNVSSAINLSISYSGTQGLVTGTGLPIRTDTLSLWALDPVHQLWVKIPDSREVGSEVTGPVTQFSVYAMMGSADTDASSVNAFPVPWRPHGRNSGTGIGETGTEAGGITFTNLPSECTIKIFSASGELARELHHSDLAGSMGQEKWDGNTTGGEHAASGVYLWRVESSADGKNGKLMIIR